MARDLRITLAESHMISVATSCHGGYPDREEWDDNGNALNIDITNMIPQDSVYSKATIEHALYNLNSCLNCHLGKVFRWEFVINLFGRLNSNLQHELAESTYDDTNIREQILSEASRLLVNMPWPSFGTDDETKEDWKKKMKIAIKECMHPIQPSEMT